MSTSSYENWSREDLIARLQELEGRTDSSSQLPANNIDRPTSPRSKSREFDFSSHPRRKIALRFCYSGWEYNGLAYQLQPTALPTVEGVIFDALSRTRLIDPAAGYDGCGWEKCGRTDRGVSAGGQVISLWVRSALATPPPKVSSTSGSKSLELELEPGTEEDLSIPDDGFGSLSLNDNDDRSLTPSPIPQVSRPELNYVSMLNRVLPPTIRMLAWSPVSDTFSARFACKYRHYKYFFSSENLDIPKMQNAASRLLGLHDFRNLCKLDPAKQITIFDRKILRADISPVDSFSSSTTAAASSMYVLDLVGTAFLYHQVRHIMAVLFLVGRGLEHPSVVSSLLNTKEGVEQAREEEEESLEVVNCKPEYQMADALPLMLWDCAYSDQDVNWRTDGHEPGGRSDQQEENSSAAGAREVYHLMHSICARSEIYSTLNQHFLEAASLFFPKPWAITEQGAVGIKVGGKAYVEIPFGGGDSRKLQQYTPLLKRKRLDSVEVVNERWLKGKGSRKLLRDQRTILASDDEADE